MTAVERFGGAATWTMETAPEFLAFVSRSSLMPGSAYPFDPQKARSDQRGRGRECEPLKAGAAEEYRLKAASCKKVSVRPACLGVACYVLSPSLLRARLFQGGNGGFLCTPRSEAQTVEGMPMLEMQACVSVQPTNAECCPGKLGRDSVRARAWHGQPLAFKKVCPCKRPGQEMPARTDRAPPGSEKSLETPLSHASSPRTLGLRAVISEL